MFFYSKNKNKKKLSYYCFYVLIIFSDYLDEPLKDSEKPLVF